MSANMHNIIIAGGKNRILTGWAKQKMEKHSHFTSVYFKNFKAFKSYWVSLKDFNVLLGPNNAGKSTVLGAFRILSVGIKRARARKPVTVPGPEHMTSGYPVSLDEVPRNR